MICENSPITNAFVSVPSDMGQLNCAAFLAGVIAGVLDSSKFNARVTAHFQGTEEGSERTVFLVKFSAEVMSRERKLG
jgi:trafficking protein particle complex subunit 5